MDKNKGREGHREHKGQPPKQGNNVQRGGPQREGQQVRRPDRDRQGRPQSGQNSEGPRGKNRPNSSGSGGRRHPEPNEQKVREKNDGPKIDHHPEPAKPKRSYGILIFQSLNEAKDQLERVRERAREVDQLNIVIRQETSMEDPELNQYGKVFAGAAWTLIHERRQSEGWYNEPQ